MDRDKMMTIKDIAKLAGVSTATVSRVLNGQSGVNPEKQEAILRIVKEYDYKPNLLAKGFQSQKTYIIGVVIADISNPFYGEVMKGIEEIALSHNYTPAFFNTDYSIEKERRVLDFLRNGRVDGLIASVSNRVVDEISSLADSHYPLVLLGHMHNNVNCPKVGCNNVSSAYSATEYLIKKGHRKIIHVAGHRETKTGIQRLEGYKSAMQNYDIPILPENIIYTDYFESDAYKKMQMRLKLNRDFTAVFVANDYLAAGCYKAILETGLKIPEDVSVIGHDDIETAKLLTPGLTTMAQQKRKVGILAAQNLFKLLNKEPTRDEALIVPTSLLERDSVYDLTKK